MRVPFAVLLFFIFVPLAGALLPVAAQFSQDLVEPVFGRRPPGILPAGQIQNIPEKIRICADDFRQFTPDRLF